MQSTGTGQWRTQLKHTHYSSPNRTQALLHTRPYVGVLATHTTVKRGAVQLMEGCYDVSISLFLSPPPLLPPSLCPF